MPKRKRCPICQEDFPPRSYYRHYASYFDQKTNSWLDHGEAAVKEESNKRFKNLIDDFSKASDQPDAEESWNDVPPQLPSEADSSDECDQSDRENSDDENDDEPEHWDIPANLLDNELGIDVQQTSVKKINSVLYCVVYAILYIQVIHHISDSCVEHLLQFLFRIFQMFGADINNQVLAEFCIGFPPSLYLARKLLKLDRDDFKRFVVCPSCFCLYEFLDCIYEKDGIRCGKQCSAEIKVRGKIVKCNSPLVKQVICKGNIRKFYPLKVYCLNSVINGIENILKRKEIGQIWQHWQDWEKDLSVLRDIYDGKVWKQFLSFNGEPFLSDKQNVALMMNIDWFQPFKHRNDYSVGVIYFVLLNLPRSIRFRSENVIIAGLIPAFKKEPHSINSFLNPIVSELEMLWKGVRLDSSLFDSSYVFRAALLCVSCDIPAARKCCGFKSHAARLGCHKCMKIFPGDFGEKRDYSGFDRQNWKPRTKQSHNLYARRVKNAANKTQAEKLAREYGTFYSVLIELEYFDAIQFCVIDPMHNLFLGTAKKMFKLWVESGKLSPSNLETIEERLESLNSLTDIGRIPTHISGNYGVFSAAEWKNWTTTFSLYCLCGLLPDKDYKCWEKFVLACRLLCKPFLTVTDIQKSDLLLLDFCRTFEKIYPLKEVTCNMHLHNHLKECLLDFGPMHVFWCFSFERFNGAFGHFHTNNKAVEIQFMRKIMTSKFCDSFKDVACSTSEVDFSDIFFNSADSLLEKLKVTDIVRFLKVSDIGSDFIYEEDLLSFISLPKVYKLSALDKEDLVFLMASYRKMFPSVSLDINNMGEVIKKFGFITILGENFGSKQVNRKLRSSDILAHWATDQDNFGHSSLDLRPCRVDFYFSHTVLIEKKYITNVFAKVSWYKEYSERFKYGNALQMWHSNKFESLVNNCFIPIQKIHSRFSKGLTGVGKDLMCICPIPRRVLSDLNL